MNQTSAAPAATSTNGPDVTGLVTNVHLIVIAILAAAVIIGIIYGAMLKRRRADAERRVKTHAEQAGVEPIPAAAEAAPTREIASEAPVTTDTASVPASADAGDGPVTQLKGLGPKVAVRLGELGITSVGQLAALDHDAAQALDAQMGPFQGRLERDRWIEQARFLAAGDVKGFEAVFGRL